MLRPYTNETGTKELLRRKDIDELTASFMKYQEEGFTLAEIAKFTFEAGTGLVEAVESFIAHPGASQLLPESTRAFFESRLLHAVTGVPVRPTTSFWSRWTKAGRNGHADETLRIFCSFRGSFERR